MKSTTCPSCDSSSCYEETYSSEIEYGSSKVQVDGLKRYVCEDCEAIHADDSQSRYNLSLIQRAKGLTPSLILGPEIRSFRDSVGITQREASKLFGGGLNAFSKYETGEVVQSEPMDNLLWLAMKFPGLIEALADRRGVQLSDKVRRACGAIFQMSFEASDLLSKTASAYGNPDWSKYFGNVMFHAVSQGRTTLKTETTFNMSANDTDFRLTGAGT
jgi:HTH-type transcriptional regulator / antitoxin MqsA